MQKFLYSENGSVSIFLALIILGVFFFQAVLVDYARVMSATKQTEQEMKKGLRSTLASYDHELYQQYGLFGILKDDNRAFKRYLELNQERPAGFFQFATPTIDPDLIQLSYHYDLGQMDVFEDQILQEMKYQAPVNFTVEIADKFKPLSLGLKETSASMKVLKDMKELYEEREAYLYDTLSAQRHAQSEIGDQLRQKVKQAHDILHDYPSYVAAYHDGHTPQQEGETDQEYSIRKAGASTTMQSYRRNGKQQIEAMHRAVKHHQQQLEVALQTLQQAIETNNEMENRYQQVQDEGQQYEQVHAQEIPSHTNTEMADYTQEIGEINRLYERADELIFPPHLFEKMRDHIEQQRSVLNHLQMLEDEIVALNDAFQQALNRVPSQSATDDPQHRKFKEIGEIISERIERYNAEVSQLLVDQEKTINDAHGSRNKEQEQEYEQEANTAMEQMNEWLDPLKDGQHAPDEYQELRQSFHIVGELVEEYSAYNQLAHDEDRSSSIELHQQSDDANQDGLKKMDVFFTSLSDLLANMRNELYVNEYAMARFENINFKQLQADDAARYLANIENQELEYIIYGIQEPGANAVAALTEIFGMRMAIHSLEAISNCARVGHPLAVFMCVLSRATQQAVKDMQLILNGQAIPFTSKSTSKLGYADHLRFILFYHGGKNKLERMLALIQHRTGKDLREIATYIEGQVKGQIPLWFIPGIIEAISKTNLIGGNVNGRYYEIDKSAVFSY